VSVTTLTRRLAELRRAVARRVTDDVDLALAIVEMEVDALHGGREPTIDDVIGWFLDNFKGDIEPHREYIQEALAEIVEWANAEGVLA